MLLESPFEFIEQPDWLWAYRCRAHYFESGQCAGRRDGQRHHHVVYHAMGAVPDFQKQERDNAAFAESGGKIPRFFQSVYSCFCVGMALAGQRLFHCAVFLFAV